MSEAKLFEIRFNDPESAAERAQVKDLPMEEQTMVISALLRLIGNDAVRLQGHAHYDRLVADVQRIQRFIWHYENLCHFKSTHSGAAAAAPVVDLPTFVFPAGTAIECYNRFIWRGDDNSYHNMHYFLELCGPAHSVLFLPNEHARSGTLIWGVSDFSRCHILSNGDHVILTASEMHLVIVKGK